MLGYLVATFKTDVRVTQTVALGPLFCFYCSADHFLFGILLFFLQNRKKRIDMTCYVWRIALKLLKLLGFHFCYLHPEP